jgi:lactate dehydrogenase-like 2-hydroxyacid dehydrogenase
LTWPANPEAAQALLADHAASITGLVSSAAIGVSNDLIDRLPHVRVISNFGVGLDKIDVAYAKARGIAVGYTPDVLNDCVADTAFGLMLDIGRGLSAADRFVRDQKWTHTTFPLGFKVSGAKLGIVGMGRIGRTIAKRATGFDMEIRYHARNPVTDVTWAHVPSLLELAKWSDFLIVITAGGAETKHLINADVLSALGPQGFLINVARGSVVDEIALMEALEKKTIAGAGLDVFANEPHVPERLMHLENIVMLPHIASATQQTRQAMADRVFDNLTSFFKAGCLISAA